MKMNKEKMISSLIAIAATAIGALSFALISTEVFEMYSTGMFIVTPVVCGTISVLVFNRKGRKRLGESLVVSVMAGLISLMFFLLVGFEGLICLVMCLPIVMPLFLLGGLFGFLLSRVIAKKTHADMVSLFLIIFVPFFMGFEKVGEANRSSKKVVTKIEIQGDVYQVWKEVIEFSEIPDPEEFLFRMGIAYPISAKIVGTGVGAVRYCEFSTGDFVEPITVWEENKRLAFDVSEQPVPMTEVSFHSEIHPPHLNWAVLSERGEFLLNDIGDGRVELTGTTWFYTVMEPEPYWSWLSEIMIHKIHERVLGHIKTAIETEDDRL